MAVHLSLPRPRRAASPPGSPAAASGKKQAAKSKEELAQEKKKELEKRLQDVSGQLSSSKKPAKKGSRPRAVLLRPAGSRRAAGGRPSLELVAPLLNKPRFLRRSS